jgi:hypothetical protein
VLNLLFYNAMGTEVVVEFMQTLFLLKTKIFRNKWTFHEKSGVKIMTNSSVEN